MRSLNLLIPARPMNPGRPTAARYLACKTQAAGSLVAQTSVVVIVATAAVLFGDGIARGSDVTIFPFPVPGTVWRAELETSGNWFDEALWTNGVPDLQTPAFLVNGSETLLSEGEAEAQSLHLTSANFGRSTMTQTGGQLEIDQSLTIQDGIYRQVGGRLIARSFNSNRFLFSLSPSLSEVPVPPVVACDPRTDQFCGFPIPDARFSLDGGEAHFLDAFQVAQAQVEILGGRLRTGQMFVEQAVTPNRHSAVNQRGGVVEVDGELKIQDGIYALAGGELNVERLALGDPMLEVLSFSTITEIFIQPPQRSPEFLQTGGDLYVADNLELCIPGFPTTTPVDLVPVSRIENVVYRLQAGNVLVENDTIVGSLGLAPAIFLQSGGDHRTRGTLRVEGLESRYDLTGGNLRVGTLAIGTDVFQAGGTFSIASAADLLLEEGLRLGALARLEATADSRIELAGGDVEIQGTDPLRLEGLSNLTLSITGNAEPSTLEVASRDLGRAVAGFAENFSWEEIIIGDEDVTGHLRLVDEFANLSGADAIYVDRLVVTAGSSLDLNGINLYYREAKIAGEVALSGGSLFAVPVPEPAIAWLLSQIMFGLLLRRDTRHRTRPR